MRTDVVTPIEDIAVGRPEHELRSFVGLAAMFALAAVPILALQDAVDSDAGGLVIAGLVVLVVAAIVAGLMAVAWTIELRRVQVHTDRVTVQRRRIIGRVRRTEIPFRDDLSAVVVAPARHRGTDRAPITHHGRWWEVRYGARPVVGDITTAVAAERIAAAINAAARPGDR